MMESMYRSGELTINALVGNLQVYELHHLLPTQEQLISKKGMSLALKTTKGSSSSKDVNAFMVSNGDLDPNKEEMELLAKRFIIFFRKKKPSCGVLENKLQALRS